ncbi:MAG: nitrilase-related carbon-nitrogen hydrolase [Candidatus Omnitrophota bacterium]|jgi:apolipoprotein N-acyltransferase
MSFLAVSILSAFFWSLPYLTSLWVPAVFLALTPVLYLVYSRRPYGLKYFILIGIIASFVSLYTVRHYSLKAYLASVLVTAVFAAAFLLVSKKMVFLSGAGNLSLFIPPAVWTTLLVAFNFQSFLTGAFDMGIALPYSAPLIWYTGSVGITFLIILWSSALAKFLAQKDKFSITVLLMVTAVLSVSVYYSMEKDIKSLAAKDEPVRIALVQNNIAESWEWLQQNPYRVLKVNQDLTREAEEDSPDIIVWPEYSLPIDIVNSHAAVRGAVSEIARDGKAELVMGSVLFDRDSGWHEDVAVVMDDKGKIIDTRSSVNPAPFNRFTKKDQAELKPVERFGTVICWEELNPDISRGYVNNGAEFLLSLTNNQDLDKTRLKYFAPFYSRARAAENMRYYARSANTGLTQVVDPLGRVVKYLAPGISSVLTAEVYPIKKKTFYTEKGPLVVVLVNILVGIFSFLSFLKRKSYF